MPVNYDIANVYDPGGICPHCNGSGVQSIGSLGYRACQYCITGYKVKHCEWCHGKGCEMCVGHLHGFYNELTDAAPAPIIPDTTRRNFAGEQPAAPPRVIQRPLIRR